MTSGARRFPWAPGEKDDPVAKEAAEVVARFERCVSQVRQYLDDGCYAPLGGLMQYLAADARKVGKACSKLMMKYGR